MEVFKMVSDIALIVFSVILSVVITLQPSKSFGSSPLMGAGSETYFSKYKAKSLEGKLILLTKIFTVLVMAIALGLVIAQRFWPVAPTTGQ